jgi:hypothetical protein
MRLANDIPLKIGHQALSLRASLRAASQLESRYGFQTLFAACAEGKLSVIADVIELSSNCREFLQFIADMPLIEVLPPLLQALPSHILALAGVDPDKPEAQSGESIPFPEYYAKLFRIGTGWLGWPPAVTWEATASEITEAYKGHLEMLRAVHGGAEPDETVPRTLDNSTIDRDGLQSLKTLGAVA